MINRRKTLVILPIVMFFATGCRKDLCFSKYHPHTGGFEVVFDKDCMEEKGCEMKLIFYPTIGDGAPIVRFVIEDIEAIDVPVGNYNVIAYNNDIKLISFDDENNYDLCNAYLKNIDRDAYESDNHVSHGEGSIFHVQTKQLTVGQPDDFYMESVENFKVEEIPNHLEQKKLFITIEDEVIIVEIALEINGLHNVKQARGVVSDICNSLTMHDHAEHQADDLSTVFCDIKCGATSVTTEVRLFSFSRFSGSSDTRSIQANQRFIVDFLLKDGTVINHIVGIREYLTDEIKRYGGRIHINTDITIPDVEIDENGGFAPEVEGWKDEIIVDIPI